MKRTAFFTTGAVLAAGTMAAPARAAKPGVKRFDAEKWELDRIIESVGMDWDQGRSAVMVAAMGPESTADMAALRTRIKKFDDFLPAFEAVGRRREALAREHDAAGRRVSARDNYYMATQYYGHAQWTIDEKNDRNLALNAKKREMFTRYAALADHHVEYVMLKTKDGKAIPTVLHLPPGYVAGTKIPAIAAISGMDGWKERTVTLYGDRWMNRGVAVLAVEAPGEWEAPLLDSFVSVDNAKAAGPALYDYLASRPEIDPQKIALTGSSFGTFFSVLMAASEPRFRAIANQSTIYEAGGYHIFETASPTFKRRFMFMSGYTDEVAFDRFAKTLTLDGAAQRVSVPFLTLAGEDDELCPIAVTDALYRSISAPRRLVVYGDSRHSLAGSSVALGPSPGPLAADWMLSVFDGKSMPNERWFVDAAGRVTVTPYS